MGGTALQRSKKSLGTCLASDFCNCLQHASCESSAWSSNGRAAALQGRSCWQDAAIPLCCGSELGPIFPFFPSTHPGEHRYKYIRLFLSPLTQQSRSFPYKNLLHCHEEQMLVVLLTEHWKVVTKRIDEVIWSSSEMTCVPQVLLPAW